jgi:GT2 family glycosyltransferase
MAIKLSIIILSYNTSYLLKQTLASIPQHSDWEIIVVDNASSDDSVAMVQRDFPQVLLMVNKKNVGFAAGNNQALRQAKGDYLLLLNSDTIVQKNALENLLNAIEKDKTIGVITPKVILPDGAIDLACHRGMPTPWRAFTYFLKLEQFFPGSKVFGGYHLTHEDFNVTHEIEAVSGVAMMVRREVIEQVGLLDERFFFYAEDLDWCLRIRQAGWKIVYFPDSVIIHFKSQSGKKNSFDKEKEKTAKAYFYDTMLQFYDKHYEKKYPKLVKKLVHLGIGIKKILH